MTRSGRYDLANLCRLGPEETLENQSSSHSINLYDLFMD